jgi:hypothetical protein
MCGGVGKFYRRGTERALERKSILSTLKQQFTAAFKVDLGDSRENVASSRRFGAVYCHALVGMHDEKIWRDLSIGRDRIGSYDQRLAVELIDAVPTCENNFDERAHKRARKAALLCFSFVKAISIVIILKYR